MKKIVILIFLIINLLFGTQTKSFSMNELQEFYERKIFKIENAILEVNTLGGFADGKYKLKNSVVKNIDDNLYKVILELERRKNKFIRLKQKRVIFILYDNHRVWIKFKDKIHKYDLSKKVYMTQDKIFYKQKRSTLNAKIDKLNLFLSFI